MTKLIPFSDVVRQALGNENRVSIGIIISVTMGLGWLEKMKVLIDAVGIPYFYIPQNRHQGEVATYIKCNDVNNKLFLDVSNQWGYLATPKPANSRLQQLLPKNATISWTGSGAQIEEHSDNNSSSQLIKFVRQPTTRAPNALIKV